MFKKDKKNQVHLREVYEGLADAAHQLQADRHEVQREQDEYSEHMRLCEHEENQHVSAVGRVKNPLINGAGKE